MTTKQLNVVTLGQIADKNDTSEAVFSLLAARERSRSEIDLGRLKLALIHEGFKIIPQDFIETFRELAKTGVGEFVHVQGQKPKFRWHFDMKEVGRVAIGDSAALRKVKMDQKPLAKLAAILPIPPAPKKLPETKTVVVILASGRKARLEVPADTTHAEAKAIGDALQAELGG